MPSLSSSAADVSPSITAALLLAGNSRLKGLGLSHPTARQILHATGANRSHAYALKARIEVLLSELSRPPGRPPQQDPEPPTAAPDIMREVHDYLCRHPGCVVAGDDRTRYSVGFRQCVLEVFDKLRDTVTVEDFANASAVPLGTLKDWLRGGNAAIIPTEEKKAAINLGARGPQIETLLAEWERWKGPLNAFCQHVQLHCRIPFGKTLIARMLDAHGVRARTRRPGRSPDERALRGAFETFFPHAQWVGDGTCVPVQVDDEVFNFNVELDVDAYSGAFLGTHVSDTEDSDAVVKTTRDAKAESNTLPIALLLDNKPSNHTDKVKDELGHTLLIRSTPYRGQNKAHIEGAFGLLKPTLEGLTLEGGTHGGTRRELAASFLRCLVTTWARTINQRPRRDRGDRTRADLLTDVPTPEQVQHARAALQERLRKQEKARETESARQNPVVRQILANAYECLGLEDPDGHTLTATARYTLESVIEAIAIFKGRRRANTLPEGVDARYLLGIARHISEERETWEIALYLWDARVAAGDALAAQLNRQQQAIQATNVLPEQCLKAYIDQALQTPSRLDRFFWLTAAADIIKEQHDRRHSFHFAARRIAATHTVKKRDRQAATRFLAAKVLPLR